MPNFCVRREGLRQRFIWSPTSRALLRLPALSLCCLATFLRVLQFLAFSGFFPIFSVWYVERVLLFGTGSTSRTTSHRTYCKGGACFIIFFVSLRDQVQLHIILPNIHRSFFFLLTASAVCSSRLHPTGKCHHPFLRANKFFFSLDGLIFFPPFFLNSLSCSFYLSDIKFYLSESGLVR